MSEKRTCPACDAYGSAVYRAFIEGEPCPYCDFPADAAELFDKAESRGVDNAVLARMVEAEKRATKAESEAHRLRTIVDRVQRALTEPV